MSKKFVAFAVLALAAVAASAAPAVDVTVPFSSIRADVNYEPYDGNTNPLGTSLIVDVKVEGSKPGLYHGVSALTLQGFEGKRFNGLGLNAGYGVSMLGVGVDAGVRVLGVTNRERNYLLTPYVAVRPYKQTVVSATFVPGEQGGRDSVTFAAGWTF